jgi:hypothetical protein
MRSRPALIATIVAISAIIIVAGLEVSSYLSSARIAYTKNASSTTGGTSFQSSEKGDVLSIASAGTPSPVFYNLTATQGRTNIGNDVAPVPYYGWQITGDLGDLQPDVAWFSSNVSGLTLSDQTCSGSVNKLDCGPYEKVNQQHTANFTEIGATLNDLPENLTTFSINVDIPSYTFFQSCAYNVSSTGCSYEGTGPMVVANFALATYRAVSSFTFAVNVAEVWNGSSIALATGWSAAQTLCSVNGCDTDGSYALNETVIGNFTGFHRLTIVTDRASYLEMFADDRLVYSNHNLESLLMDSQFSVEFYQFTSVNNETSSTTWSNFVALGSPDISVSGLSQGMVATIKGPGGFTSSSSPNASGVAVLDASACPADLTVAVEENGEILAMYPETIDTGTALDFALS